MRLRIALGVAFSALLLVGMGSASATSLPTHVYAPYFETWTTDSLTTTADAVGRAVLHAGLPRDAVRRRSCTLAWNGAKTQTVATGRYLCDIASLAGDGRRRDPSFGGWSADQGGTEIGDSCKSVAAIAAAYRAS